MRPARVLLFITAVFAGSCGFPEGQGPAARQPETSLLFTEWAGTGIDFVHYNGASEKRLLPETMGSGVAVFDFDRDGLSDIYFVNGSPLGRGEPVSPAGRLFRNLGGGRFENVTVGSGLDLVFYGLGAAVGDIDNDGWPDLAVTALGTNRLFRNLGNGRFEDVTDRVGGVGGGFSTGAAFLDYDRDGFLDLMIVRYVPWSIAEDIACTPYGGERIYCTPEVYPPISNLLFKNEGGTRFADRSEESGISLAEGKGLGLVVFDYNDDGWPDVAVANDTTRNFLFVNQRDGSFQEQGETAGLAYSESGATRGGMGIDAADANRDGYPDVVIGNFSQEMLGFYKATEDGFYVDDAAQSGLGIPTLMTLAFGTLMEDLDGDGWLDLVVLNGHIEPDIARLQRGQSYRQAVQFFRNLGKGDFQLLSERVPDARLVGRGLASGDLDRDGDLDLVITQNGGPALLLRNDHPRRNWIQLEFEGRRSNRTGWGVVVSVRAGGAQWRQELSSGRSYLSSSEPVMTIGLGDIDGIDELEIAWPSGVRQIISSPAMNQRLRVTEPAG